MLIPTWKMGDDCERFGGSGGSGNSGDSGDSKKDEKCTCGGNPFFLGIPALFFLNKALKSGSCKAKNHDMFSL